MATGYAERPAVEALMNYMPLSIERRSLFSSSRLGSQQTLIGPRMTVSLSPSLLGSDAGGRVRCSRTDVPAERK